MLIKHNWLHGHMTSFVCSWTSTSFCTSNIWFGQAVKFRMSITTLQACTQMQQWRTITMENLNCTLIWSPFSAIDLKRGSLLFFSTGSESRKETVIFVALYSMPHLWMPNFKSEVRQLNIAFTDLGTPSYLAGQLLCQPQENNKQGVPSLRTPPNKTAR